MFEFIDVSFCLGYFYKTSEIKIRIIEKFIFIEAESSCGVNGGNFSTYKYKTCYKLDKTIDITTIKAYHSFNIVRISNAADAQNDETELCIDKRQAYIKPPEPWKPHFDEQANYERFLVALKSIGML